jgi:T-complex protein 1 subunit eta
MDKLIHDGKSVTISNDGATLIGLLDIVHPAAKTLVDIARSQDNEVGDGTTSVVMMAGELLKQSKTFIDEGMHSQIIIKGYREALKLCLQRIKEISVKIGDKSPEEKRDLLLKCAMTPRSLASRRNFSLKWSSLRLSSSILTKTSKTSELRRLLVAQ